MIFQKHVSDKFYQISSEAEELIVEAKKTSNYYNYSLVSNNYMYLNQKADDKIKSVVLTTVAHWIRSLTSALFSDCTGSPLPIPDGTQCKNFVQLLLLRMVSVQGSKIS